MRALVVEPEAEDEIARAVEWYEAQEAGLGTALLSEIDVAMDGLAAGRVRGVGVPGLRHDLAVRRLLFDRFPYSLVFIEHQGVVHVLAVAHQKREPGYWKDRVPPR